MSELLNDIQQLEYKFSKIIQKNNDLELKIVALNEAENTLNQKIQSLENALAEALTLNQNLKMTNALLGSDTYKRDTKLKINSIIKEIDHCVMQLSRE